MMQIALLTLVVCLVTADVHEKARLAKSQVPSSFVGLEAPLAGAATSPEQRRVISLHHNPEDENNLERLCNDPFHSFLCKPVGPRRRIDGRLRPGAVLPPNVLPAASNRREEKQPLEEGSALLPASQAADRNYLPPPEKQPPIIRPEPQYLPPLPTPKIDSLPSNPSKVYLPVFQTTEKPTTKSRESVTYKPPSNSYLPIKLTQPVQQQFPQNTNIQPVVISKNAYLPPDDRNILPESTNLSPNIEGGALLPDQIKPASVNDQESHTLERLCNDPFHSFLCKPLKARKRIDGKIRPGAKLPPNFLLPADSIRKETKVLPTEEGSALLSSNLPGSKSHSNIPDGQTSSSNKNVFSKSLGTPVYNENLNIFQNSFTIRTQSIQNGGISSFSEPSAPTTTPEDRKLKTNNFPTQKVQEPTPYSTQQNPQYSLQAGYNYPRPSNPLTLPVQQSIQTTYSTTFPPTIKYQQAYPSNVKENILPSQNNGYSYPRPAITLSTPKPFVQTLRPHSTKPTEISQESRPSNVVSDGGYRYPKPLKPFNETPQSVASSNVQEITSQAKNSQRQPSEQKGYSYPKPAFRPNTFYTTVKPQISNTFATQTPEVVSRDPYSGQHPFESSSDTQKNTKCQCGSNSYVYQRPTIGLQQFSSTNIQENIVQQTQGGYIYEKPSEKFSFSPIPAQTTTGKPLFEEIKSNKRPNYQFQSPTNNQQVTLKPQESGYYYNEPSTLFTYPSTTKSAPTTSKPTYDYPSSSNIKNVVQPQDNGYRYEKPSISFTYPTASTTTKPALEQIGTTKTPNYPIQSPSNNQEVAVKQQESGYYYKKPSTLFTYPTTTTLAPTTTKPTYQDPSSSNIKNALSSQNSGYYYDKPSKSLTYPSPSTTRHPSQSNIQQNIVKPQKNYLAYNNTPTSSSYPSGNPNILPENPTFVPTSVQQTVLKPANNGYDYLKPSTILAYPTKAPFHSTTNNLNPLADPTNLDEVPLLPPSRDNNGYNYPRPNNPLPFPSQYNEQYAPLGSLSNYGEQILLRFGDRIKLGNIQSITKSKATHDDEFKPLRNFELI